MYIPSSFGICPYCNTSPCECKPENKLIDAMGKQEGGSHYKDLPIQPAEYNQKNKIPYCEANVIKYVSRHRNKGGKEDILKAIHYLEMVLEMEYGDS